MIEFLRQSEVRLRRVDHIRGSRGEFAPRFRSAGLRDHRPGLRRARNIQRPAHRERRALVTQHMHFRGVEIAAAFLVANERIVIPRVPQTGDDVEKFLGTAIARLVIDELVTAEIFRFEIALRRNDIPAHSPLGDVIERGESTRQIVGFVIAGGGRRDETQTPGPLRDRRDLDQRLQHFDPAVVAQRIDIQRRRAQSPAVGPKDEMNFSTLGRLRHSFPLIDVETAADPGLRMPPAASVVAIRRDAETELHLALHSYTSQT